MNSFNVRWFCINRFFTSSFPFQSFMTTVKLSLSLFIFLFFIESLGLRSLMFSFDSSHLPPADYSFLLHPGDYDQSFANLPDPSQFVSSNFVGYLFTLNDVTVRERLQPYIPLNTTAWSSCCKPARIEFSNKCAAPAWSTLRIYRQ